MAQRLPIHVDALPSRTLVPLIVQIHPSGRQMLPGRLRFTNREPSSGGDLWLRFRRHGEPTTILNRCHRFRGFVYEHACFSTDKKSIEVVVHSRMVRKLDLIESTTLRRFKRKA
jgi:hypothetical protein